MLAASNSSFLIDHEMGLELNEQTIIDFGKNQWDKRFVHHHISYRYLVEDSEMKRTGHFDTFEEYLRNLNIYTLQSYLNQLHDLDYSNKLHPLLLEYLNEIKNNSVKFVNLLRAVINEKGV